ncbi:MAG TPA: molybdopterin molybdotransferase MoeA, partial [Methylomirabilota bacterium]|nr:molybdopterin molybdotransferase MoeA [Methylomirabilota bacterium]
MTPAAMAVAAAGGHAEVLVHGRPRVAILATGNELAPIGRDLGDDEIPDSNSVGLAAQGRESGAEVRSFGIARDELGDVVEHLRRALEWAHVVVVSGGVSVGAHDVVKEGFATVGTVELWRIAVQPGKPLAFARTDEAVLFGLPGNPVSSFVTFELFVRPVLRRLSGHSDLIGRDTVTARLGEDVTKSANRRAFLRVRLEREAGETGLVARLAGGQDSHVLSALAVADGLAIIPEDDDVLPAGSEVEVMRLR